MLETIPKQKKKFIGKLPQYESYKLLSVFYQSLTDMDCMPVICHNCQKMICNIAIVENSQGAKFEVGLDCAGTLTNLQDQFEYKMDLEHFQYIINQGKQARAAIMKCLKKNPDVILKLYSYINIHNYFQEIGSGCYELDREKGPRVGYHNYPKEVWQRVVFPYIKDLIERPILCQK